MSEFAARLETCPEARPGAAPPSAPDPAPASFRTTCWTQVLAARGRHTDARAALGELCRAYYEPVVVYLSRREPGLPARDVAHEFFANLLSGDPFSRLERDGGRFRSYLLGALKHFLSHRRESVARLKRGAGVPPLPLFRATDSSPGIEPVDADALPPDAAYDRAWAHALLARALASLRAEFLAEGREAEFDLLKPWLVGEAPRGAQADAARALVREPGALKASVHRLRLRFRRHLRARIADTLQEGADVEAELRALHQALGS